MDHKDLAPADRVWNLMGQIESCLSAHPYEDAATHEALDFLKNFAVPVLLGFGDEMPDAEMVKAIEMAAVSEPQAVSLTTLRCAARRLVPPDRCPTGTPLNFGS